MAIWNANGVAKVHFVVIPKDRQGLTQFNKATESHKDLLGHLLRVCAHVAKLEKLVDGYRIVINDGKEGCQTI